MTLPAKYGCGLAVQRTVSSETSGLGWAIPPDGVALDKKAVQCAAPGRLSEDRAELDRTGWAPAGYAR